VYGSGRRGRRPPPANTQAWWGVIEQHQSRGCCHRVPRQGAHHRAGARNAAGRLRSRRPAAGAAPPAPAATSNDFERVAGPSQGITSRVWSSLSEGGRRSDAASPISRPSSAQQLQGGQVRSRNENALAHRKGSNAEILKASPRNPASTPKGQQEGQIEEADTHRDGWDTGNHRDQPLSQKGPASGTAANRRPGHSGEGGQRWRPH